MKSRLAANSTTTIAQASATVTALGGLVGTGVGLAIGSPAILGTVAVNVAAGSLIQIHYDKTRDK